MSTQEPGVIFDFSMFPLDKGESLSPYVAKSLKIIKESGLSYRFGPMSTAIEGTYDQCAAVMRACFEEMSSTCGRVVVHCKVDYRRGREDSMESKLKSVQEKVATPLNT